MPLKLEIDQHEADHMLHAVDHLKSKRGGRAKKLSNCYRNYFAADKDGDNIWDGLVNKNFATVNSRYPTEIFPYKTYHLTEEGFTKIKNYLEIRRKYELDEIETANMLKTIGYKILSEPQYTVKRMDDGNRKQIKCIAVKIYKNSFTDHADNDENWQNLRLLGFVEFDYESHYIKYRLTRLGFVKIFNHANNNKDLIIVRI